MKRSEMVTLITKVIKDSTSFKSDEAIAKQILKRIEEAGMLPPLAEFKGTKKGCLCTMRECCSSCGGFCNEWEPE